MSAEASAPLEVPMWIGYYDSFRRWRCITGPFDTYREFHAVMTSMQAQSAHFADLSTLRGESCPRPGWHHVPPADLAG